MSGVHMRAGVEAVPEVLAEAGERPEDARTAAAVLAGASAVDLVGCGSSLFAAAVLGYAFDAAGLRSRVTEAYEYAGYPPPAGPADALIAISHTGRTPDVVAAARAAAAAGRPVIAITDDGASPLAAAAGYALVDERGMESALPKTRSYVSTLVRGLRLARELAALRGAAAPGLDALAEPAGHVGALLAAAWPQAADLADRWADAPRYVVVGAGPEHATALEGALKITEAASVYAVGWQIEEAAHGTWVSTRAGELAIVLAVGERDRDAVRRTLAGLRAIGAATWVIGDDEEALAAADAATRLPALPAPVMPLLTALPLYCFAHQLALGRGLDPDVMRQDEPRYREARTVMRRSISTAAN
ncbi:SIS domain-containing protein [Allonocardiopsis opalescens]|uniref:Glutamine--fructose-6-phosphate aminotransferase [isomerizing] n=1 Tax=Allonocardiopsis opalescens TaxID=1144618 RepID=A0A2T0Q2V9_9ACTN|nr:SIS domain-containing protein [Allonocardiopsis opalescens]PRX98131.1 SIS domain-containing protein [Allonocardiopsis opalescens]